MAASLKILVAGDVEGHFDQLFHRIKSIQKKAGQFDMLFCVGDFFGEDNSGWEKFSSGQLKAPVATFVLGPNNPDHVKYFQDPDGCELRENITFLGRKGMYTGSSGLQVAYLSGLEGITEGAGSDTHFSDTDVEALKTPLVTDSKFRGVDLLLTSQWPAGVEKYGSSPEGVDSIRCGSRAISQLSLALQPRYHFCALEGAYFERQPYRNHMMLQENARHVTRFISLARVGNPQKKKYLYAFNITPMKSMDVSELVKQPDDVTECPFKFDPSTAGLDSMEKSAQFFFDQKAMDRMEAGPGGKRGRHDQKGGPPKKKQPQPTGPCWFCLGSPEVEKHLVISVATQTYLALAKGPLVPDHVLITTIGHHQSTVTLPSDVLAEVNKYKTALKKCYKSQGKAVVFFERNYKTQHLQIQAVSVPMEVVEEVKDAFDACAQSKDIELAEIPKLSDLKQIIPLGAPYFYAELPKGEKLLYKIGKGGFDIHFGRAVLAHEKLLDLPHKINWRDCMLSKDDETSMAKQFRQTFQPFDFNDL